jgi:N6-adenosine-specific RNA methylase IME4
MGSAEFAALKDDIAEHGQREAIWVFQEQIVDGRHRFAACSELGLEPRFCEFEGAAEDLPAFVVSLNLHRRHLNESQRAMVAANIARLEKGANQHAQICAPSQAEAAELLSVSRRSVQVARKVLDQGVPELVEKVTSGEVAVSTAAKVAELPQAEQVEIVAKGEAEILQAAKKIRARKTEERREERLEKIVEISQGNAEIGLEKTYPVIYADPPWRYEFAETESRAIENQYPTMTLEDICALPISELATKDAILFMWATAPKLEEAMRVVSAWGFTYRTCLVWCKERMGMGYYARIEHELLLVATRGSMPAPAPENRPRSVFSKAREEHSAKPEYYYEVLEAMYPTLSRIELFSRNERKGWDAWGNQSAQRAVS